MKKHLVKIYDEEKFWKYYQLPVRIKSMGNGFAAIAEGSLLAHFFKLGDLRDYFPQGTHKEF